MPAFSEEVFPFHARLIQISIKSFLLVDDSDQQGIVNNVVCLEEFYIVWYYLQEVLSLLLVQIELRTSSEEVIVFACYSWSWVVGISPVGRTFQIISFDNLVLGVEHIRHYDEITSRLLWACVTFLDEFVQTEKLGD